jgi:hypothetical protein
MLSLRLVSHIYHGRDITPTVSSRHLAAEALVHTPGHPVCTDLLTY